MGNQLLERRQTGDRRRLLRTVWWFALALAGLGVFLWWGRSQPGNCPAYAMADTVQVDLTSVVVQYPNPGGGKFIASVCIDGACVRQGFTPGTTAEPFAVTPSRDDLGPAGAVHRITAKVTLSGRTIFTADTTAAAVQQEKREGNCSWTYFTINLTASGSGPVGQLIPAG